jgi:2-polyprenyl-3-methyl-5-hydroxy-6-metoxy-1,4-benzoquinol methylase
MDEALNDYKLVANPLGYQEIVPKPDPDTLAKYYNEKYFLAADGRNPYAFGYNADEIEHKYIDADEAQSVIKRGPGRLLEVGCGEGFFLDYFARLGWDVRGFDFTSDGIDKYFPHLKPKAIFGDAFVILQREVDAGNKYDLVVCNNVLEHVVDPSGLLRLLQSVTAEGGVLRIVVPNDFSWLQKLIVSRGGMPDQHWVCPPDHLSYFNVESFCAVLQQHDWNVTDVLGNFPIDLFLLNDDSNYVHVRERGRACHFARIAFELALWKQGIEKLVAFRRGCAAGGVGRNVIVYASLRARR